VKNLISEILDCKLSESSLPEREEYKKWASDFIKNSKQTKAKLK
jgi:hypothetical protein